jgi:hypothetical protein
MFTRPNDSDMTEINTREDGPGDVRRPVPVLYAL